MTVVGPGDPPFPDELWLCIIDFLDLDTQKIVLKVSKTFHDIVTMIWRAKVFKIKKRKLVSHSESAEEIRYKLVMNNVLEDHKRKNENFVQKDLLKILETSSSLLKHETSLENYDYFHDYNRKSIKWLDLSQKWPRPGAKTLSRFTLHNLDLVYLSVSDCRENIEAVHHLLSSCVQIEGLQLFAIDPLLPYCELSRLRNLQFLEIQFDTFYRDHRESFLENLAKLQNLKILRLRTCYGLSDTQVVELLRSRSNSLVEISFPLNSRIQGWCLESILSEIAPSSPALKVMRLYINTAYSSLTHNIPELHADNLIKRLREEFNISVEVTFIHLKLLCFNPKDMPKDMPTCLSTQPLA